MNLTNQSAERRWEVHLPATWGRSLPDRLTLRCCRACPCGKLLRDSESWEMYLDLLWMWVKGEDGLALGLPKPCDLSGFFVHFVWDITFPVMPLDLALMFVTGRSDVWLWSAGRRR